MTPREVRCARCDTPGQLLDLDGFKCEACGTTWFKVPG